MLADDTQWKIDGVKNLAAWLEKDPVLQRNDCSRLHRLLEAMNECRVYRAFSKDANIDADMNNPIGSPHNAETMRKDNHVFVVKHDWLGVLGDANLPATGELKLPYPLCTFEFRVSDRNVIVFAAQDDEQLVATGFQEGPNGIWFSGEAGDRENAPMTFVWKQILAACTAMDAEVATHEVTRAPHALNKKRAASGKIALFDFHTVDLARHHRVVASHVGGSCGRKRLHFRRGHWRHYEASKTWIRWCLVGDPSLGFVDKEYAL